MNVIYDDYLIIFYTFKLIFIGKITIYYDHNQVRCLRNISFISS